MPVSAAPPRPPPPPAARARARWLPYLAIALICGAALVAYRNSLHGEFVFDDYGAIVDNPTIRRLWPPGEVLSPPINGLPVTGRPITNLSFAVNYAIHGTRVFGYHLGNLAVHVLCGLTLFGILRRELARASGNADPSDGIPVGAAAAASLVWTVHPLVTAGVTYVSQRAESLGSLFLLVSLYAFIRSVSAARSRPWLIVTALACWLGIATKEFNAFIPLLILVYDRSFVASSWRELLARRRFFYVALFASWVPLAGLIASTQNRGGTWGAEAGLGPGEYLLLQCQAVVHYLRLTFWPHPLVFDYGRNLAVPEWWRVLPHAALLAGLLAATIWGVRRRARWSLAGVMFFGILAPTSSAVPLADAMFEHRMYLPAAAVIATGISALYLRCGHKSWLALGPLALGFVILTAQRNADYRTAIGLWRDTVAKVPHNARARGNLGAELARSFRHAEALPHLEASYRQQPQSSEAAHDLAVALEFAGRREEAISLYREALRLSPDQIRTRLSLANALAQSGAMTEALDLHAALVAAHPDTPELHTAYGRALLQARRTDDAIAQFRATARLLPDDPEAHFNLGDALAQAGRLSEAKEAFAEVVRLNPAHAAAFANLGNLLLLSRQTEEAIAAFRRSLELRPDARTHTNLGYALLLLGQREAARAAFEAALQLDPAYRPAREGLARTAP